MGIDPDSVSISTAAGRLRPERVRGLVSTSVMGASVSGTGTVVASTIGAGVSGTGTVAASLGAAVVGVTVGSSALRAGPASVGAGFC